MMICFNKSTLSAAVLSVATLLILPTAYAATSDSDTDMCGLPAAVTDRYNICECVADLPIRARPYLEGGGLGYYGFLNQQGEPIIDFIYTYASSFDTDWSLIEKQGKYGYIDKDGMVMIPIIYDKATAISKLSVEVSKNGKRGYIDTKGNTILPIEYQYIDDYKEGLALAMHKDDRYVYIDGERQVRITTTYEGANGFKNGRARVKKDGKYGYIDPQGQEVIKTNYADATEFLPSGNAAVKLHRHWGMIDRDDHEVTPFIYDEMGGFNDGLVKVTKKNKTGYINESGKPQIPLRFSSGSIFYNGLAIVTPPPETIDITGTPLSVDKDTAFNQTPEVFDVEGLTFTVPHYNFDLSAIDWLRPAPSIVSVVSNDSSHQHYQLIHDGQILSKPLQAPKDKSFMSVSMIDNLMVVDTGKEKQIMDADGMIRLSGDFEEIHPVVNEQLALVKKAGQWQYYRILNKEAAKRASYQANLDSALSQAVIEIGKPAFAGTFDDIQLFSEGLAFVQQAGKGKIINTRGSTVFTVPYTYVMPFVEGSAIFMTEDDKYGVMDTKGHTIIAPDYDDIRMVDARYYVVTQDDYYGLYDQQGAQVLPVHFRDIKLSEHIVLTKGDKTKPNDNHQSIFHLDKRTFDNNKIELLEPFKDGFAVIRYYNNTPPLRLALGILSERGQIYVFNDATGLDNLSEGQFLVTTDTGHYVTDTKGHHFVLDADYDNQYAFAGGHLPLKKDKQWYVVDKTGKPLIPPTAKYAELTAQKDGTLVGTQDNTIIDKQGDSIIDTNYRFIRRQTFDDDGYFRTSGDWHSQNGLISPTGQTILPAEYDRIEFDYNDMLKVVKDGKVGMMSLQGQTIIPFDYYYLQSLKGHNYAASRQGDSMGLLDNNGKALTDERYADMERRSENLIAVQKDERWGLIDNLGKEVTPIIYERINDENEGRLLVKKNNKYGYLDTQGRLVIDIHFDKANSFYSDDEAYIEMDGKAYYIDTQGQILRKSPLHRAEAAREKARPD